MANELPSMWTVLMLPTPLGPLHQPHRGTPISDAIRAISLILVAFKLEYLDMAQRPWLEHAAPPIGSSLPWRRSIALEALRIARGAVGPLLVELAGWCAVIRSLIDELI